MTLILCVDDRGGLSFNGRRQSQDRRVREDLLTMAAGGTLWMDGYSRRQFTEPEAAAIQVDRDPAARAAEGGGLCLLELQDPETALERADRLVLYRWGRRYPADRRLDLPPKGWRLEGRTEFPGRSRPVLRPGGHPGIFRRALCGAGGQPAKFSGGGVVSRAF